VKAIMIGLPHFSRQAADFLREHGESSDRFVVIDTSTRRGKARYLFELPTADTVFTLWGTLNYSRVLELALQLHTRVVQFWVGSDVLAAIAASRAGAVSGQLVEDCIHLCESTWTRDELATVGVRAEIAPLPPFGATVPPSESILPPEQFSILGYVGKGSESFYRLPDFVRLAADFPDIPVRIAGIDSAGDTLPPNVELLGWTDDVSGLYDSCAVYVRIPEHDGYSFSVREALACGKHVVASYPYPHCREARTYEALRAEVAALKARFDRQELEPNWDGREFVLRKYEDARVARTLARVLAGAKP
jgi:glycosyltransferase involved in cell wall biosynthesis